MQNMCKKVFFVGIAVFCSAAYAEEYRAIVNNYSSETQPLTVMIRIDGQTQDGSGFFVVKQIAQNEEGVELVAEKTALLARYTNAQEQRIINSESKIVTLEVQCDLPTFCFDILPAPVVLSVDPAVTPVFDITGGGENPIVVTQQ